MKLRGSFFTIDHQGKGMAYSEAMIAAGYRRVSGYSPRVNFCFSDLDVLGRLNKLQAAEALGARVFLYPHAARPAVQWDGLYPAWDKTTATFVVSQGHIDVMRAYGYAKPLYAAGWSLCPIVPFKARTAAVPKVLFAPIHPNANGFLAELDQSINAATHDRLVKLHKEGAIALSIRYLHGLELNGLHTKVQGVRYIRGLPNVSLVDMREADVVVSHQTYAYVAVASGIPTLMMAEHEAPRNGNDKVIFSRVSSWDKYKNLMMYPLDILVVDDPLKLIHKAMASDHEITDWRCRMIGQQFDPQAVVNVVESYL